MLAQKFPERKVKVFDRLGPPPSPNDDDVWSDVARFYLLGLGGRGQRALTQFGVWDEVEAVSTAVVGRKDWSPGSKEGVERIFSDRPVTTQVLPRDKLVGVLYKHVLDNYLDQVEVNYGYEVTLIDFAAGDGSEVVVRVTKCAEENIPSPKFDPEELCNAEDPIVLTTNLLISADGTSRTIANQMEEDDKVERTAMNPIQRLFAGKPFTVTRYKDDNQRVYKSVPFNVPKGWRQDLNYSARTEGSRVTLEALPADRRGSYCGILLMRADDPLAAPNADPVEFRRFFQEELPQFNDLVEDETMASIAKKPPSFLPGFRYVSPRLNQGDRTVLLGDCAHTVKPYFGLGCNSALEDVVYLSEAIDATDNLSEAVHLFSKQRAPEAVALVKVSRELDRPGKLGFITFILPIILDSIFHKLAPKLFEPNNIQMLQRTGYSFCRLQKRKRLDRIMQAAIIGTAVSGIYVCSRYLVRSVARALGRQTSTIVAAMGLVALASVLMKKLVWYLRPGREPTDVIVKTSKESKASSS
jgi:2-polyprenyl-6-methoxyphenol hydroxylase-like FAD-dependent oxidoreductase